MDSGEEKQHTVAIIILLLLVFTYSLSPWIGILGILGDLTGSKVINLKENTFVHNIFASSVTSSGDTITTISAALMPIVSGISLVVLWSKPRAWLSILLVIFIGLSFFAVVILRFYMGIEDTIASFREISGNFPTDDSLNTAMNQYTTRYLESFGTLLALLLVDRHLKNDKKIDSN